MVRQLVKVLEAQRTMLSDYKDVLAAQCQYCKNIYSTDEVVQMEGNGLIRTVCDYCREANVWEVINGVISTTQN